MITRVLVAGGGLHRTVLSCVQSAAEKETQKPLFWGKNKTQVKRRCLGRALFFVSFPKFSAMLFHVFICSTDLFGGGCSGIFRNYVRGFGGGF